MIGEFSVSVIDTALVLKCLEPIWKLKPKTASRLHGRLRVCEWAAARRFRSGDNPARWRGHLDKLLPPPGKVRAVKHHASMAYADLPQFMRELRAQQDSSTRALELTILTALRTSEVINARWSEIDFGAKLWTIPAERMKAGREHRVPLSKRAIEILDGLPRGQYLFSGRGSRPIGQQFCWFGSNRHYFVTNTLQKRSYSLPQQHSPSDDLSRCALTHAASLTGHDSYSLLLLLSMPHLPRINRIDLTLMMGHSQPTA
jgi:integrase